MCLLIPGQSILAEDRDQPVTIAADRAEINERDQVSIYSGNVELTQGGLKIWADVITVYTVENQLDRLEAKGNPARYQQERANEETIRGHSQQLDYDANSEKVLLRQDAELWQGENHFTGERILYDMQTQNVLASGTKPGTDENGQRVQVTIQPKSKDAAKP